MDKKHQKLNKQKNMHILPVKLNSIDPNLSKPKPEPEADLVRENKKLKNLISVLKNEKLDLEKEVVLLSEKNRRQELFIHDSGNINTLITYACHRLSPLKCGESISQQTLDYINGILNFSDNAVRLHKFILEYQAGIDNRQIEARQIRSVLETLAHSLRAVYSPALDIRLDCLYDEEFNLDKLALVRILQNASKNAYEAVIKKEVDKSDLLYFFEIKAYTLSQYIQKESTPVQFKIQDPKALVIVLNDNIGGVKKEQEALFFNRGFTDGKPSGQGLGTFSIKDCVENMLAGEILLKNKPGIGLSYHICLPNLDQSI